MNAPMKRTPLEWARAVARTYRSALLYEDPDRCADLDAKAKRLGQHWIAPVEVSAEVAEVVVDKNLSAPFVAQVTGIPVGTIYSWVSRGILKPVDGSGRTAKFSVREVLEIEARRRPRQLDTG